MAQVNERNQDATVFVGDLDPQVTEALLWELMLQVGPVINTHIPKDKLSGAHSGFGFVEFVNEEAAEYAIRVMVRSPLCATHLTRSQNMVKLFGRPIRVNRAARNNRSADVGANLFVGNLDPDVDEKLLYDTFSAFGMIVSTPKIMRDPDTNASKGYGFVSFDNFAASDMAIEVMNGQYLCNRPVSVTYALKKDSKGERHGTAAERLLAQQGAVRAASQPNPMFRPPMPGGAGMPMGMGGGMGMGMGMPPAPGGAPPFAPPGGGAPHMMQAPPMGMPPPHMMYGGPGPAGFAPGPPMPQQR